MISKISLTVVLFCPNMLNTRLLYTLDIIHIFIFLHVIVVSTQHEVGKTTLQNKTFNAVTHVIFDVDDTIFKTEDIYALADTKLVNRFGMEYPWDIRMKTLGCSGRDTAEIIVRGLNLPISIDDFRRESERIYLELLPNATLIPGVERLIRHLYKHNIPMALATSSHDAAVKAKFRYHQDLFKLFRHITMFGEESITKGKPAPDIYIRSISKFPDHPPPEKCLVFEDSPNGVKAAISAKLNVVMVPDKRVSLEDRKEATLVLESFDDFKPEMFGLPSY